MCYSGSKDVGCRRNTQANKEASFKRAAGEAVSSENSYVLIGVRSGERLNQAVTNLTDDSSTGLPAEV